MTAQEEFHNTLVDSINTHEYYDIYKEHKFYTDSARKSMDEVFKEKIEGRDAIAKFQEKFFADDSLPPYIFEAFFKLDPTVPASLTTKDSAGMNHVSYINPLDNSPTNRVRLWDFVTEKRWFKMFKNICQNGTISDIVDLVTSVSTDVRKNKSGKQMENRVTTSLKEMGMREMPRTGVRYSDFAKDGEWVFISQCTSPRCRIAFGIPCVLPTKKKFDYVISNGKNLVAIETNFYQRGGSKPDSVIVAHDKINKEVNTNKNCKFVWITDGSKCWAPNGHLVPKMEYALGSIKNVINLHQLEHGNLKNFLESLDNAANS